MEVKYQVEAAVWVPRKLQSILGTFAEIGEHVFDNRYVEMF